MTYCSTIWNAKSENSNKTIQQVHKYNPVTKHMLQLYIFDSKCLHQPKVLNTFSPYCIPYISIYFEIKQIVIILHDISEGARRRWRQWRWLIFIIVFNTVHWVWLVALGRCSHGNTLHFDILWKIPNCWKKNCTINSHNSDEHKVYIWKKM